MTVFLLLETVAMKACLEAAKEPFMWIQHIVMFGKRIPIVSSIIDSKMSKEPEGDLIESLKKLAAGSLIWQSFQQLIDRLVLIAFAIMYLIMFVGLMPNESKGFQQKPLTFEEVN